MHLEQHNIKADPGIAPEAPGPAPLLWSLKQMAASGCAMTSRSSMRSQNSTATPCHEIMNLSRGWGKLGLSQSSTRQKATGKCHWRPRLDQKPHLAQHLDLAEHKDASCPMVQWGLQ